MSRPESTQAPTQVAGPGPAQPEAQPAAPQLDLPRLDPRYKVVKLLGTGGMAAVWRACDERLGRDVALKVLHRNLPFSSSMRERLEREAKVAASLTHENVVQVYDYSVGTELDSYIAMELVDGRTLRDFLTEHHKLSMVVVALITYELCRGLAYAHERGVTHRDLKPDNVMVSRNGSLKIADFGIARARDHAQMTATGVPVGTPAYLSPEQVRGEPADIRSDIFALGISLYELTCGKLPFDAETSTGIMYQIAQGKFTPPERTGLPDIDPELAALINRCLSAKAADRPTAAQIYEQVGRMLQQRQVLDPRQALAHYFVDGVIPLTEVQPRPRAKLPRAALAGAGLFAIFALAAVTTWMVTDQGPPPPPPPPVSPPQPPVAATPPPPETATPAAATPVAPEVPAGSKTQKTSQGGAARSRGAPISGLGTLHLTVRGGWADVRVDGVLLGRTPTDRDFPLKAGLHKLELANPHRAPFSAMVHIPAGGTLEREVELQPVP